MEMEIFLFTGVGVEHSSGSFVSSQFQELLSSLQSLSTTKTTCLSLEVSVLAACICGAQHHQPAVRRGASQHSRAWPSWTELAANLFLSINIYLSSTQLVYILTSSLLSIIISLISYRIDWPDS